MVGNSSFVVYIDESGDEGFTYEAAGKSSDWFVLSACVVRKSQDLPLVQSLREIRDVLGKPKDFTIHFRDLKHEQKVAVADRMARIRMRFISIAFHKPSLTDSEYLRTKNSLYFYLSRYLLERVSWLCREMRIDEEGDGSVDVVFSNRSAMPYQEMRDYVAGLVGRNDVQIDWNAIKPAQMTAIPHRLRAGLQVVDAVASSTFSALEPGRYGFTEDRYLRLLLPVAYRHQRKLLGYGLKIWPAERLKTIQADPNYSWLCPERA